MQRLAIAPPAHACLSLVGTKGFTFRRAEGDHHSPGTAVDTSPLDSPSYFLTPSLTDQRAKPFAPGWPSGGRQPACGGAPRSMPRAPLSSKSTAGIG